MVGFRVGTCLCVECRAYNFAACPHVEHTGALAEHTFVKETTEPTWSEDMAADLGVGGHASQRPYTPHIFLHKQIIFASLRTKTSRFKRKYETH